MAGKFKLSAQSSNLAHYFESHPTFWQKATFNNKLFLIRGWIGKIEIVIKFLHNIQ